MFDCIKKLFRKPKYWDEPIFVKNNNSGGQGIPKSLEDAVFASTSLSEGFEPEPYLDTVGKLTIGYGRNLVGYGLKEFEIEYLQKVGNRPPFWLTPEEAAQGRAYASVSVWLTKYPLIAFEAEWLARNNIKEAYTELQRNKPFFRKLHQELQEVFIDMHFNMGLPDILEFKKMWASAKKGDTHEIAVQMADSAWHRDRQVGDRSQRLIDRVEALV